MHVETDTVRDVPQQDEETTDTSSIGGTWPPEMTSHHRMKAFFPDSIRTADQIDLLKSYFNSYYSEMTKNHGTRQQFRALFTGDMLRSVASDPFFQDYVEAILPLGTNDWGDDMALVYIGKNTSNRQPDPRDLAAAHQNLTAVQSVERVDYHDVLSDMKRKGYEIEILSTHSGSLVQETIDEMFALYERFGWTMEEMVKLLNSSDQIIAVAKSGGHIVSAGIAQFAQAPIDGKPLRIAEITEAATLKTHEGNGCYMALSSTLLHEISQRSSRKEIFGGEIDMVFGECNALSQGVLRVSKKQGRSFVQDTGVMYGYPNSVMLYQQVPIESNGTPRHAPYNDLVPTFLNRDALYEYYAK